MLSNFRPFFDFNRICPNFCALLFFSPICVSFSRKKTYKTAFFLAYTKKSTTSFGLRVVIIRSVKVICKFRYVFLVSLAAILSRHATLLPRGALRDAGDSTAARLGSRLCISQFQQCPPPPPRAIVGHFPTLSIPGVGH